MSGELSPTPKDTERENGSAPGQPSPHADLPSPQSIAATEFLARIDAASAEIDKLALSDPDPMLQGVGPAKTSRFERYQPKKEPRPPGPLRRAHRSVWRVDLWDLGLAVLWIAWVIVAAKPYPGGWNDMSRLATVQVLAEHGTFTINGARFYDGIGDKVRLPGQDPGADRFAAEFRSDKQPLLQILAAGVYWIASLFGVSFASDYGTALRVLIVAVNGLSGALLFYSLRRFVRLMVPQRDAVVLVVGATLTGSVILSWGTVFGSMLPAAATLTLGAAAYAAWDGRTSYPRSAAFWTGVVLSLCTAFDVTVGGLFCFCALVMTLLNRSLRPCMGWLFIGMVPLAAVQVALNYVLFSAPVHGSIVPALWEYTGSSKSSADLSGIAVGGDWQWRMEYVFHCLLGKRGMFLYTPLLILATWGWAGRMFHRTNEGFGESMLVVPPMILAVAFLVLTSTDYAGAAFGMRWFVTFLPLQMAGLALWWERHRSPGWVAVLAVLWLASAAIAQLGAINPWAGDGSGSFPLLDNLAWLRAAWGI